MINYNGFPMVVVLDEGEDAYEEVYKAIEKYIKPDDAISLDSYYVTLELISNGMSNTYTELIRYDFDIDDYVWDNDWWEGEYTIIIHGLADIDTIHFYGFHKDKVVDI